MNKLDPDILSIISANLNDETINEMRMVSVSLSNNILKIKNSILFWKERTELLIGKYIMIEDYDLFNWKQIYKILLRYIGTGPPYEILPTFKEKDCIDAQNILKKYGHNRPDTDKNIIEAIDIEDYNLIDGLIKIKPPIYNNTAFLYARSMGLGSDEIISFLDNNRVDILTMDQNLLFETITDTAFNAEYNSDILLAVLKKLDVNKEFIYDTLEWAFKYGDYQIINYLIENKNINISDFYPDRFLDIIINDDLFSEEEVTEIIEKILKKFDTNQKFNNEAFLYFLENIKENKDIIDWLLDTNKIDLLTIEQTTLFKLLSESKVGIKILCKILKNPTIKFKTSNIYNSLSDNTSDKFVKILLGDPRFNPELMTKLPKYLTKLTNEMMALLKYIIKKYDTSDNFNNQLLLHYLSYGNMRMAIWVVENKQLNLSNINNEKLFNLLSKNDAVYILSKILKNKSAFDGYHVYEYLDVAASSAFIKILLNDPRFDPSLLKIRPYFLSDTNANVFLSDPRVNITIDYLRGDIMKEYIKDSLGGLIAMHYLYDGGINIYTTPLISLDIVQFYYKFLRYLVVKKPKMLDAVIWLKTATLSLDKIIINVISNAADSVINNSEYSYGSKYIRSVYYAFKAFFLLAFKPRYTYKEILEMLKKEGVDHHDIGMIAKIIGAKLGLNNLIKDGLIITKNLQIELQRDRFLPDLAYFDTPLRFQKLDRYTTVNR
jgi:hypothetical protein